MLSINNESEPSLKTFKAAPDLTRNTARAELRAGIEDVRFWPDAERGCAAWWAARVRFLLAERDGLTDALTRLIGECEHQGWDGDGYALHEARKALDG